MRILLLMVAALAVAFAGCQQGAFLHFRKGKDDKDYALLLKSVDQYARKNGVSREEAIRQLREQANAQGADQGGLAGPSSARRASPMTRAGANPRLADKPGEAAFAGAVQPAGFEEEAPPDNPLRR